MPKHEYELSKGRGGFSMLKKVSKKKALENKRKKFKEEEKHIKDFGIDQ